MTAAQLLCFEPVCGSVDHVGRTVESFSCTTHVLLTLAEWLESAAGDEAGSKLVAEFAVRFAEHEVTTL